jgi:hypothetical protein
MGRLKTKLEAALKIVRGLSVKSAGMRAFVAEIETGMTISEHVGSRFERGEAPI